MNSHLRTYHAEREEICCEKPIIYNLPLEEHIQD